MSFVEIKNIVSKVYNRVGFRNVAFFGLLGTAFFLEYLLYNSEK